MRRFFSRCVRFFGAAALVIPLAIGFAAPAHAATTGTLTVSLTDSAGAPLPGVVVYALYQGPPPTPSGSAGRFTDLGDGTYSKSVVASSYKIYLRTPGGLLQYVPGQTSLSSATVFTVADGQTTSISEQLLPSGTVQVSLVDRATSAPVTIGCVRLTLSGTICNQPDGRYRWIGVPLGASQISVTNTKTEWPGQQPMTVTAGMNDTQVALDPAAAIQTTVQTTADPSAHPAACVYAVYPGADDNLSNCTQAGTDGSLLIGPLRATTVQLFVAPSGGGQTYGAQWVGPNGGTGDQRQAMKVNTVLGAAMAIPPIQLDGSGAIEGWIFAGNGYVTSLVNITPFGRQDGLRQLAFATTESGYYAVSGLGPYAWPLEFTAYQGGFPDSWSGGAPDRYSAAPIMVTAGATARADVAIRSPEGFVHGTVQMNSGTAPANGYTVTARNAITGDDVGQMFFPGSSISPGFQLGGLNTDPVLLKLRADNLVCQSTSLIPAASATSNPVVVTIASPTDCGAQLVPARTLPPVLTSKPAAVANPSARRQDVFATSNTDLVARGWTQSGGWSNWANLGGNVVGTPAAFYNPRFGSTEVYARNAAHHLEYRYWTGSAWSSWTDLGGDLGDDPTVLYNPRFGSTEVYVRTSAGHLAYKYWSSGWSDWIDLGGSLASSPALIYNPRFGSTEAYVRTTAGHLAYRYWSNGWSGWIDLGGDLAGRPGVIYNPRYGTTEAYVRTNSGHIQYVYWNNSWSNWNDLGGNATSDPSVVYVPPGPYPHPEDVPSTEVFTTIGGQVVENGWTESWIGWTNVGGNTGSGVAATYNPINANVDVDITTPDGYVYQRDGFVDEYERAGFVYESWGNDKSHIAIWANLTP